MDHFSNLKVNNAINILHGLVLGKEIITKVVNDTNALPKSIIDSDTSPIEASLLATMRDQFDRMVKGKE